MIHNVLNGCALCNLNEDRDELKWGYDMAIRIINRVSCLINIFCLLSKNRELLLLQEKKTDCKEYF